MITRIELKNFMSHEHTVIEPAAGLTVLVGPNNCGKSAVVAALQILCRNDNSTYVMRHGEKECTVQVETDDGHTIQWRRKKSPSYVIDGTEFSRLQQSGIPDELHQSLRLPKVEAGNDTDFDVHFGTQKDPIFLLRNSSGNAAKFFASSSDAIRLVEMQKRHKDKLTEARGEKNRLEAEAKQNTAELELLEPAVELEQRIKAAEHLHAEIQEQTAEIQAAEQLAADLELQSGEVARHLIESQTLRGLVAPPALAATDPLALLIEKLAAAQTARVVAQERAAALAELALPPPQHDTAALAQLVDRLVQWRHAVERSTASREAVTALERPPEMADALSLANILQRLETATRERAENSARSQRLQAMPSPPVLENVAALATLIDKLTPLAGEVVRQRALVVVAASLVSVPQPAETQPLMECVARLEAAERSARTCSEALVQAESELAVAEERLRQMAAGSVCVTCGGPLDPDRMLALATAGMGGRQHDEH